MTTVVVLQPGYLPWLGFFDQMARSDVFVVYDDVQFDKQGWRNRNRIKGSNGAPQWLTVPVKTSGRLQQRISEVEIDDRVPWARKHLMALQTNYRKAPHFAWVYERLEPILSQSWQYLMDMDLAVVEVLRDMLDLHTPMRRASELDAPGERVGRLVEIASKLHATTYLTGNAAEDYLEEEPFRAAGIGVEFQNYVHPTYPQLHGEFVPYLSVVDLLVMCGPASREIVSASRPCRSS